MHLAALGNIGQQPLPMPVLHHFYVCTAFTALHRESWGAGSGSERSVAALLSENLDVQSLTSANNGHHH